jgi:hypothetical protein
MSTARAPQAARSADRCAQGREVTSKFRFGSVHDKKAPSAGPLFLAPVLKEWRRHFGRQRRECLETSGLLRGSFLLGSAGRALRVTKTKSRAAPFEKRSPKGCATQFKSLSHPPERSSGARPCTTECDTRPGSRDGNPGSILTEYLQHSLGVSVQVTCFQCVELGRRIACKLVGSV